MESSSILELEAQETIEPQYDANDPAQVNEARKKSGRKRAREREQLQKMMSTPDGRAYVFKSIECILVGNPMISGDPYSTYYNLGQEKKARDYFKEVVKICPTEFISMINENGRGYL